MANIVLTTHWTGGDVYPFIRIGSVLKERGHCVTLLTHCHYEDMAKRAGLNFTPWDTCEEWTQLMEDMAPLFNSSDSLESVLEFRQKHQNAYVHLLEYEKVKQYCHLGDTVLVGRFQSSVAALIAAEKWGIPFVSVFLAPYYFKQTLMGEALFGDVLTADINLMREEVGLPPIQNWISWVSASKRNIALWPEWFAPQESIWPVKVVPVGFPLDNQDSDDLSREVREILDIDEPPILIACGTSKLVQPEMLTAGAEACWLLGRRGILVTQYENLVPDRLPAGVKWFKYLPFGKLLAHLGAAIHHGGIGTLSHAVAAGIPQVVLAYGVDRPDNAARLKKLGVGKGLPLTQWKPVLIAEALSQVMTPVVRKRCQDLAQRLLNSDFAATMSEAIEEVVLNSEDFLISSAGCYTPN